MWYMVTQTGMEKSQTYIGKIEVLESAAGLVLEQEREGRREIHRVPPETLRTVA